MIPLALCIKNFLSYGPDVQTVDFTPYSLICLSGKNGHGKSALLDAMTWALWGQARRAPGSCRSDDSLLHTGQTNMMVVMDFVCNGQHYRVRREYTKVGARSTMSIDVGIFDETKNAFVAIGGTSVKSNQAVLASVLRLDFDSFCNSAFLRQGQSNEFSRKSPKERKEIIAAILRLDEYEEVRVRASERARSAVAQKVALEAVSERICQDLKSLGNLQDIARALATDFEELACEEKEADERAAELEKLIAIHTHERRLAEEARSAIGELCAQETCLTEKLRDAVKVWRSVHAQKVRLYSCGPVQRERDELMKELHVLQERVHENLMKRQDYLRHKERLHELERAHGEKWHVSINERFVALERMKAAYAHDMTVLSKLEREHAAARAEHEALEKTRAVLHARLKETAVDDADYNARERLFERRKAFFQNWTALDGLMERELEDLEHRKKLSQDVDNPCCPLCQQNLSVARRRFLRDKLAREQAFVSHRSTRIKGALRKLKDVMVREHARLGELAGLRREHEALQLHARAADTRCTTLEVDLAKTMETTASCRDRQVQARARINFQEVCLAQEHEASRTDLERDPAYAEIVAGLKRLEPSLENHDTARQEQVRKRLQELEKTTSALENLAAGEAAQNEQMSRIHELFRNLRAVKNTIAHVRLRLKDHALKESALQDLERSHASVAQKKEALTRRRQELLERRGALESHRTKRGVLEREHREYGAKICATDERVNDLQAIAAAVGRDGIQALLIQEVLPEIEHEANVLLAKLTDNQAHIFIESLRDLKKGGVKETLDINISDARGLRPYEMFSGGEAFRIDFALRVALSKMLARRAGTSIQTLIIDEGFGSQDEEGLAHITDVLYKIQDDFAKIIIVSHLPIIKDQFPAHFSIERRPTGSVVTIVEQG